MQNNPIRAAILAALARNDGDAKGVLIFAEGYLSVQANPDEELLAALRNFIGGCK